MNNGRFAALFGNGADSTSGKAALFIMFADGDASGSGGKYIKLVVPTTGSNGLSQPTWIDVNNDRIADFIYAGDQQGNLWRFDVSSSNPSNWKVSYINDGSANLGQPLFKAKDSSGNALPITGAPETRFHPLGGVVVNIVTGLSLRTGDFPYTARTNGMFGLWDNPAFVTADTVTALTAALPRELSELQERVLHNVGTDDTKRYVTGDAIDWSAKKGWYMLMNVSSEMGVNNLTIANNQLLTVTVSPAPAKTGLATDPCSDTPVARLLAVDPITGLPDGLLGSESITVGDTTTTYMLASVRVVDQKVHIVKDLVGEGSAQTGCGNGSLNCTAVEGATSGGGKRLASNAGFGRIFWREIPGFKTN
jgi:type IV pilus assembly protein PilY1